MKSLNRWLVAIVTLTMLVGSPTIVAEQAQSFKLIVHPDNPAKSIAKTDLSKIFLAKTSKWEHGVAVEPVEQEDSSMREAFSLFVHGMSASSVKNYWDEIFSGRGVPPPDAANDAEVVAHVRERPGAIGYVSANARLDGVKEIAIAN